MIRQDWSSLKKLLFYQMAAGGGAAIEATATGNPLSFNTNLAKPLKSLLIPWTPTQSGTGDPYPPGGGKNLCPPSPFERGQYSNGVWAADVARITSDYIPIEPHTNYMISVDADNTANVALINYNLFDSSKNWLGARSENGDSVFNGDKTHLLNATFNDTAYVRLTIRDETNTSSSLSRITLADADLMLEKGSSVTTFAPYSNIRPISGVSAVNVWTAGKNLLQGMETGQINQTTGQDDPSATSMKRTIGYIPVTPGGKCTVSGLGENGNFRVFSYDINKSYLGNANVPASDGVSTITVGATTNYIRFQGISERFTNAMQAELGSTATEYAPYSGQTIPVVFPALTSNLCPPPVKGIGLDLSSGAQNTSATSATTDYIPVSLADGKYFFSGIVYQLASAVFAYNANKEFLGRSSATTRANLTIENGIFTGGTPQGTGDVAYIRLMQYEGNTGNSIALVDNAKIMLNPGTSSQPYEPYTSTVYGGSLDVTTGVLTVTDIIMEDTWGSWGTKQDQGDDIDLAVKRFPLSVYGNSAPQNNGWGFSNVARYQYSNDAFIHHYIVQSSSNCRVYLPHDTPENTLIQCIGHLIEPVTYQLTPEQISTLFGDNVIWTDTNGSNTAVYLKKG